MSKETFRYIDYNQENLFVKQQNGRISLKEYFDSLVFLANFDSSFNAIYGNGVKTASTTGLNTIENFDAFTFGQHGEVQGTVLYDSSNFSTFLNEGTISFYIKAGFMNNYGYTFLKNEQPNTHTETDYGIRIYKDETLVGDFFITVEAADDRTDVFNSLALELAGSGVSLSEENNKLKFTSSTYDNFIYLEDTETANSLIDLFGGVEESKLLNAPTANIDFIDFYNDNDNKNRIVFTHTTDSHILLKMYDKNGVEVIDEDLGEWNNSTLNWYNFELDFKDTFAQFFIDGVSKHVFSMNGLSRESIDTNLKLQGNATDYYNFDELFVADELLHVTNFTLPANPLTPYSKENPYIDIYWGTGYAETNVTDITLEATLNTYYSVKIGNTWYYYLSGAWREGDGTFSNSTSIDNFESYFSDLFFNENLELIIRVFFNSDGYTESYIDEIAIETDLTLSENAYIISDIDLSSGVDLSTNKHIIIETDSGLLEVDLSSEADDTSNVSLNEMIDAINAANVPGLATATTDGNGHIILQTSSSGDNAFVKVLSGTTTNALSIVWGESEEDYGESVNITGTYANYNELIRWVRSRLGEPLVPVELTDEQIEDCISSAVYHYNKWRNFKENIVFTNLVGTPKDGYSIPKIVGSESNITEIILQPKYPFSYYTGSTDDLLGNIYINEIFSKNMNLANTVADYYIALVATRDFNIIMNTEVSWEIINNKLFIHPEPDGSLSVGIKYKAPMTIDSNVNEQTIKDLTLAEAKITLGSVRSTFGNQIPGGNGMISLNGSELKSEGMQEKQMILDGLKLKTSPYEFIIG